MAAKKTTARRAVKKPSKRAATKVSTAFTRAKAAVVEQAKAANPGKKLKPADIFTANAELRLPASVILGGIGYKAPGSNSWVQIDTNATDIDDGKEHVD